MPAVPDAVEADLFAGPIDLDTAADLDDLLELLELREGDDAL